MKTLIITAPEELRGVLRDLSDRQLIAPCAASRPDAKRVGEPVVAARLALRTLAPPSATRRGAR
ncbi:transposase IS116/IS110/IS902 family protein [Streptomyces bottropensis ATCC 25435]|uniref:Transposase IS116/IS110/IS902 family protein n=1 Tax=Streptomyces bottropensis ATCC 25435 TaxID=1054862 RepID=M3FLL5_9ACTN|nr:transposase IS116/IS110/IS902 family protein [Streptomyces bottropensis ATCC 25435]